MLGAQGESIFASGPLAISEAARIWEHSAYVGILPLAETHPALAAWRERIRALPGYDATTPPHWR